MLFIDHLDLSVLHGKLKHSNAVLAHKLCRDCTANQIREFFSATQNVLLSLHHAVFVVSSFGLHRNNELPTVAVNADINFVNLDLSDFLYCRAQMIL